MSRIDRWIFDEYAPCTAGLPVYRVLFASYIMLVAVPRHLWVAEFPDVFFYPPLGLTIFFAGFPPAWYFHALNFGLLVASLCLLLGYRSRLASVVVAAFLIAGNAWAYSFGKIDHDILLVVVPLALAFTRWGGSLSSPGQPTEPGWPMALLALLIGLAMLTAAVPKMLTGWLSPQAPATLGHLLQNHFVTGRQTTASTILVSADSLLLWKMIDYATVILEAGFVVAVVSRQMFRAICAVATFFHVGVWIVMDIGFSANVIAYAAFINWGLLLRRDVARHFVLRFERARGRVGIVSILAAASAIFGIYYVFGNPWRSTIAVGVLLLAPIVGGAYLAKYFVRAVGSDSVLWRTPARE